jgi:hypothetical protein
MFDRLHQSSWRVFKNWRVLHAFQVSFFKDFLHLFAKCDFRSIGIVPNYETAQIFFGVLSNITRIYSTVDKNEGNIISGTL